MPPPSRTLAQNIEDFRIARGISRVALSRQADLGDSAVNDIVSHPKRDVRLGTIEKIAAALGVSVFDLIPTSGDQNDTDIFKPIDREELAEMLDLTADFIKTSSGDNSSKREFYQVTSDRFTSWGYASGDVICVSRDENLVSGDHVAIEVTNTQGGRSMIISYFAEPVFFGVNNRMRPSHRYAAGPDVAILGKILASIKLVTS